MDWVIISTHSNFEQGDSMSAINELSLSVRDLTSGIRNLEGAKKDVRIRIMGIDPALVGVSRYSRGQSMISRLFTDFLCMLSRFFYSYYADSDLQHLSLLGKSIHSMKSELAECQKQIQSLQEKEGNLRKTERTGAFAGAVIGGLTACLAGATVATSLAASLLGLGAGYWAASLESEKAAKSSEPEIIKPAVQSPAEKAQAEFKFNLMALAMNFDGDCAELADFLVYKFMPQNVKSLEFQKTESPFVRAFTLTLTNPISTEITRVGNNGWSPAQGMRMSASEVITGRIDAENSRLVFDDHQLISSKWWGTVSARLIEVQIENDKIWFTGVNSLRQGDVPFTLHQLTETFKYLDWS